MRTHIISAIGLGCWLGMVAGALSENIPEDSRLASPDAEQTVVLLNPLDDTRSTDQGRHNVARIDARLWPDKSGRIGSRVVELRGQATRRYGKSTLWIPVQSTEAFDAVGMWVYFPADHNVNRFGLEVTDGDGEMLLAYLDAPDEAGWQWYEATAEDFRPSFNQPHHSGVIAFPLSRMGLVWTAQTPGAAVLGVDGLTAIMARDAAADEAWSLTPYLDGPFAHNQPINPSFAINNFLAEPRTLTVRYQLQRDHQLDAPPPPHPQWGVDQAYGRPNRTLHDGEIIDEGSLTDGLDHSSAETRWSHGHKGAEQILDLEEEVTLSRLFIQPNDANWIRQVDIEAAGPTGDFAPIPGAQGITLYHAWSGVEYLLEEPVTAQKLRFRYHHGDDEEGPQKLVLPSRISVYTRSGAEARNIPQTGELVASGEKQVTIPARRFSVVTLADDIVPGPGAYLLSWTVDDGQRSSAYYENLFVPLAPAKTLPENGRFGMNISNLNGLSFLRDMGITWLPIAAEFGWIYSKTHLISRL